MFSSGAAAINECVYKSLWLFRGVPIYDLFFHLSFTTVRQLFRYAKRTMNLYYLFIDQVK